MMLRFTPPSMSATRFGLPAASALSGFTTALFDRDSMAGRSSCFSANDSQAYCSPVETCDAQSIPS